MHHCFYKGYLCANEAAKIMLAPNNGVRVFCFKVLAPQGT